MTDSYSKWIQLLVAGIARQVGRREEMKRYVSSSRRSNAERNLRALLPGRNSKTDPQQDYNADMMHTVFAFSLV